MVLGLRNLALKDLSDLGLDLGPLLLLFTAFSLVVATFQSVAYNVQSEAARGTLEHLGLARGGLLRQLLLRASCRVSLASPLAPYPSPLGPPPRG